MYMRLAKNIFTLISDLCIGQFMFEFYNNSLPEYLKISLLLTKTYTITERETHIIYIRKDTELITENSRLRLKEVVYGTKFHLI